MAEQAKAVQIEVIAPRHVYEKPSLQRLGLLRLMTRYSFAGEDDQKDKYKKHGKD